MVFALAQCDADTIVGHLSYSAAPNGDRRTGDLSETVNAGDANLPVDRRSGYVPAAYLDRYTKVLRRGFVVGGRHFPVARRVGAAPVSRCNAPWGMGASVDSLRRSYDGLSTPK